MEKVAFEWDAEKARANLRKHGVMFATEAVSVFSDELALTVSDEGESAEERFVTVGMGLKARVLVVVYTWRGDKIRIISARPAEPHERKEYEAQR
jgi:uncharacterized DUF497 family protein